MTRKPLRYTVRELIDLLSEYNPDMIVAVGLLDPTDQVLGSSLWIRPEVNISDTGTRWPKLADYVMGEEDA